MGIGKGIRPIGTPKGPLVGEGHSPSPVFGDLVGKEEREVQEKGEIVVLVRIHKTPMYL